MKIMLFPDFQFQYLVVYKSASFYTLQWQFCTKVFHTLYLIQFLEMLYIFLSTTRKTPPHLHNSIFYEDLDIWWKNFGGQTFWLCY